MADIAGAVLGPMLAKVPAAPPTGARLQYLLGDELAHSVRAALEGFASRDSEVGLPVLLLDGGEPWELGNAWMRDSFSGSETDTRSKYAGDVLTFADWCRAEGIDVEATTARDLAAYKRVRLHDDGVMHTTWNRNLMGVVHFLRWMERQDGVKRVPDKLKELTVEAGSAPVHAADLDDYRVFRDVGLRGLDLQGRLDPDFIGQTGERDCLFAELLVSTGMRRSEATHLLWPEIPLAQRGSKSLHYVRLPGVICKGGKPRDIQLSDVFLERYWRYIESEWCSLVEAAQTAYRRCDPIIVSELKGGIGRVGRRAVRLESSPKAERRRLVLEADAARALGLPVEDGWLVPMGVFPGHSVPLPTPQHWTTTFKHAELRANAILAEANRPFLSTIRPHVLRHTFGVEYLRSAMEMLSQQARVELMSDDERRIRRHFENPIKELRDLMGHAQVETTYGYLTTLRRSDPLTTMPWSSWADELLSDEGDENA